jgi:hypothetical protein
MVMRSKIMRWERYLACIGEDRNAYTILVLKSEVKRTIHLQWEDNDLK